MLVTVGIGGGFGYTGQRVIVQDEPFTNVLSGYDSINQGRFFSESSLEPYSLRLDDFDRATTSSTRRPVSGTRPTTRRGQRARARRRLDAGAPSR